MSTEINIRKRIDIQEEGVSITPDVNSINFTGSGVTASTVGDNVTVNVQGSIGATAYYLNETVTQAPYKEFSSIPTAAAEQTIATVIGVGSTATIQSFQTPSGVPNTTNIPAGLWQFYLHFSGTFGDSWDVYAEVYKRDLGGIETLLLTTDVIPTTALNAIPTMILTDGVFPASTVLTTDRIVVKVLATNTGVAGQTITFHTEGSTNYSVGTTTLNQIVPTGAVTSVTGTAPVVSSGGTTPAISMAQADSVTDGYLSSADWNTFNNKLDDNIYTADGTITANRTLTFTGNNIQFTGTNSSQTIQLLLKASAGSGNRIGQLLYLAGTKQIVSGVSSAGAYLSNADTTYSYQIGATASGIEVNGSYILPNTDGSAGQFITTDGAGIASWGTPTDTNIYNSDGTLAGNRTVTMGSNTLNFSGGNIGINQPTPTVPLHIKSTAIPSTNENIVRLEVSDAPTAYLAFNNASTVNGEFVPEVLGRQGISSTQSAIYQGGYIDATQDSGTTPVTVFRSALASLTQIATRPLFAFRNWSTTVMTILADGKVGIGTTTPSTSLHVRSTAIPSAGEAIARFDVSDSSAYLQVVNGTATNGVFAPSVQGRQVGTSTQPALQTEGIIDSVDDTGTTPVTIFKTRLATLAQVVTRPVFQFSNWTSDIMTMLANGNVGIGTTTPGEKLEVNGKTKTTTFQMTTGAAANKYLASDASGNGSWTLLPAEIQAAASDETTNLTTGTAKVTFRMPHAMTLTAVRASLSTAQTAGALLTVDINLNGVSVLGTKLTFDNTEKTTVTAATPPTIVTSALTDDGEITVDIDVVGTAGAKGLKITLIGTRA